MIVDSHMHVGDFPLFNVPMGRDGLGDIKHIHRAINVALGAPSIHPATPGMPKHSKIRDAVERVGPDRASSGSDTPFHHPSVELAKVRVSDLSTDLTDRILGQNGRAPLFGEETPHGRLVTTSVVETSRGSTSRRTGTRLAP